MDYIEKVSVEDICHNLSLYWHYNDDEYLPPMFHGTDASLIYCSTQERNHINNACETIIQSLCDLYRDNSIDEFDNRLLESKDSYSDSSLALIAAKARLSGSKRYNYSDFYISSDPSIAIGYSKEAWIFGETGQITNRLVEPINELGLLLPDDDSFKEAYDLFVQRRNKPKNPIVLLLVNCRAKDIESLEGVDLFENNPETLSLYVKGLKEKCMTSSYRLKQKAFAENIKAYVINSQLFDGLVRAWNTYSNSND